MTMYSSLRLQMRSNIYTYKGRCNWPYVITYYGKYYIYRTYVPIKAYTYWVLLKCDFTHKGESCYILVNGI